MFSSHSLRAHAVLSPSVTRFCGQELGPLHTLRILPGTCFSPSHMVTAEMPPEKCLPRCNCPEGTCDNCDCPVSALPQLHSVP